MIRRISMTALLALMVLGLGVARGWSQAATTGTITGTVRDTSGAVVPSANITIINEGTHVELTTKSNSAGNFVMPALTVGTYAVRVTKHGFQTSLETGIIVYSTQVSTVNPTLRVGSVTTQVKVVSSPVRVQISTPSITHHISAEQVSSLPLNGRNYGSLLDLQPGVTNTSPDTALSPVGDSPTNASINGMSRAGVMYYLDGVWNVNHGSFVSSSILPNPDTIQEVRTLQNNYGVKYSFMGANVVMLETKSGARTFHGSAWEFLRNTALDSRNFFSSSVPVLHQNVFGYTLGGPFFIPGHYNTKRDKTFFYWSQQWAVIHNGSVKRGADPTAAMRDGVFPTSGPFATTIINPSTGLPFPNNTIPANMLNSNSEALLSAIAPLPNNPGGGFLNYVNTTPTMISHRTDQIRVDQEINSRLRLTGEYFGDHGTQTRPGGYGGGIYPTQVWKRTLADQMGKLTLTQMLSPSMINTTTVSVATLVPFFSADGVGIFYNSQVPGYHVNLPFHGNGSTHLSRFNFSQGWAGFGAAAWAPQRAADLDKGLSDNWSWLRGNHYVQAGFQMDLGSTKQNPGDNANGQWSFSGRFTGNAMADFLLGDAAQLSQDSTQPRSYVSWAIYSPYVQDMWHATRRLTFTLGVRFWYMPNPHSQAGYSSIFDPARYNPADAPIVNSDGTITPTANYSPVNGLLVAGENGQPLTLLGKHKWDVGPSGGFAWDVFGNGRTSLRGGFGITYTRVPTESDPSFYGATDPPLTQSVTLVDPSFPDAVGGSTAPQGAPGLKSASLNLYPVGQVQSYNLSLEHQFGQNWFVSLAGVGDNALHIATTYDINQPPAYGQYDYNPAINTGAMYTYQNSPYLGYDSINTIMSTGNAHWDALEMNLRHPIGRGLSGTVSYTWQHGLANAPGDLFNNSWGVQDIRHPSNTYGNQSFNAFQVLSGDLMWDIPFFNNFRGWKKTAIAGWQFSDITTIQSGFSTDPGIDVNNQGLAQYPNRVENSSVGGPKSVNQWFNTAAFAAPAYGYFGNAAPGSITGPGTINFDMALYKNFQITERTKLQFRSEFFNAFNHTNFSGIATSVGDGNYGQVTDASDPRIIEFALHLEF